MWALVEIPLQIGANVDLVVVTLPYKMAPNLLP
jgi:hypothetical protein